MNRINYIILAILVTVSVSTQAQERIGLRMDNYQGINSIFLNPANSSTQKLAWNLNLVSAGLYGETNYGFLENSSLSNSTKKTILSRPDISQGFEPDLGQFVILDYNNKDSKKFAELNAFVTGPSFMGHINQHHFGAFVNYRMHMADHNIDEDLGYYTNRRIPLTDSIQLNRTQVSSMLWREIGGHYSHTFETSSGNITIGANLKHLTGLEVLGMETSRSSELKRISVDEITIDAVNVEFVGTSSTIDFSDDFGKKSQGTGLGIDIGATITFDDYDDGYKLKVGLAINDIGSINFNKGLELHKFQSSSLVTFDRQDYLQVSGVRDLIMRASDNVQGDPSGSLDTISTYKMRLPTALVIDADYKIMDRVYVGAAFVHRLPKAKIRLEKSNLLAIAPRYESKWMGASLPMTLVNYQRAHVGMSLRLGYLTIGTDQLGTLGTQKKLDSGDLYFSLQFFGFQKNGLLNRLFQGKNKDPEKCFEM